MAKIAIPVLPGNIDWISNVFNQGVPIEAEGTVEAKKWFVWDAEERSGKVFDYDQVMLVFGGGMHFLEMHELKE
jgi:hypothetical protein